MQILRHLKPKEQRLRTKKASKEFIQDISNVMAKLRKKKIIWLVIIIGKLS